MNTPQSTIEDIAARACVSKSTVSRVLNDSATVSRDKKAAVLEAMKALGYQPNVFARTLAGGRSMTVGIVTQYIGSPFYDGIAQGAIEGLGGTGVTPIFVDGRWEQGTEQEVIRTLLGRKVDGMLLIGGDVPVAELNSLKERLPTVVAARRLPGWDNQCISIDNVAAGYRATHYLLRHGHRQIVCIRGNKDHQDAIDRYRGYVKALEEAGIPINRKLVYQGDFTGQAGMMAVNSLVARGVHFSAIVAASDAVAFGARLALHRHGYRVPDDVSLIGFDDQEEAAWMTPPLTTMRQPAREMGAAAARALLSLIAGKDPPEPPQMSAELQVRETVARHG